MYGNSYRNLLELINALLRFRMIKTEFHHTLTMIIKIEQPKCGVETKLIQMKVSLQEAKQK